MRFLPVWLVLGCVPPSGPDSLPDPSFEPRIVAGFVRVTVDVDDKKGFPLHATAVRVDGPRDFVGETDDMGEEHLLLGPGHWRIWVTRPCFETWGGVLDLDGTETDVRVHAKLLPAKNRGISQKELGYLDIQIAVLPENAPELETVAREMLSDPALKVEIRGYGPSASSLDGDVAMQRAWLVRNWLTNRGVPAEQLVARGYELEPGEPSRVEFSVLETGGDCPD